MYSSTGSSSSSILDCFPAPPPTTTQHVSFPMSHLRHSGPAPALYSVPVPAPAPAPALLAPALAPLAPRSPLVVLPATAPEIDAGSSSFLTNFSSPSGALGLHTSSFDHPSSSPSPPSYSPHTVISLGEEWTDQDTASDRPASSSLDVFGDSDSYFAFSPTSSSSSSLSPEITTEQLPLWQAEHARLLSIRDAVLSSERATRYREACLESEVARIKDDLARVKEARTRARWVASRVGSSLRRNSAPDVSQGAPPASTSLVRRASDSDVVAHQRAAERQWQQQHSSSSSWFYHDDDEEEEEEELITIDDDLSIPAEYAEQLWDEHDPDPEMMLANNLTEARSARAEERRKRKRDHERIRELGILLSLGSEVRQWEERLAWENAFCSDDASMELDHVEDAASRRRSKSLPTTPASSVDPSSSSSALTPPLPPLSASPLWRVSAEMILRRRSLSERPRRVTPLTAIPCTHEAGVSVGPSTSSGSNGGSGSGSDSGSNSSSSSAKPVPPPISITSASIASSLKTAPSRPSALKLSFTLEDLVAPEGSAVIEKIEENTREDEEMGNSSAESSDASDSDDSRCKSSNSNSSSSENEREGEKRLALRRGRSRWSWRRSLQSAQQLQLQLQLQQIVVDMEVDDA